MSNVVFENLRGTIFKFSDETLIMRQMKWSLFERRSQRTESSKFGEKFREKLRGKLRKNSKRLALCQAFCQNTSSLIIIWLAAFQPWKTFCDICLIFWVAYVYLIRTWRKSTAQYIGYSIREFLIESLWVSESGRPANRCSLEEVYWNSQFEQLNWIQSERILKLFFLFLRSTLPRSACRLLGAAAHPVGPALSAR